MRFYYLLFMVFLLVCCQDNVIETADNNSNQRNQNLSIKDKNLNNDLLYKSLQINNNDSINRQKLFDVVDNYYSSNNWAKFKEGSQYLLKKSIEANDTLDITKSYMRLGYHYMYNSINDSAYNYFLKAQRNLIKLKDKSNLIKCFLAISELEYYACDYVASESTALRALKYSRFAKEPLGEYNALMSIGINANSLGDFQKANEYYNKAMIIAENILPLQNSYRERCLNNIGFNYFKIGDYKQAIKHYNEALQTIDRSQNNKELYVLLLDNLAYAKFKTKDFSDLPNLYFDTYKLRDSLNIDQGKNYNRLYLSEYKLYLGDTIQAKLYAEESLIISKGFSAPKDILESLKQLILIDPNNASDYSQQYIRINDSLQLAERKMQNKFARIAYETEEITIEKDDALKKKSIISWIALGIFLIGSLIFVIRYQKTKQKELLLVQEQQKSNESIYQLLHDRDSKIDEARQVEKKRIAQELHDGVMNKLTSTRLNLFILNKKKDDETIEKCLNFINDIQDIEKEIRQVAHDLNKDLFSPNKSFNNILEVFFNDQRGIATAKIHPDIDKTINWGMISSEIKINLYRILQESLQNCNKYAHAKNIFVTIQAENDMINTIIQDDGIGFNLKKARNGIGLKNIADRVKILSGKFEILSSKGNGTRINILFPVKNSNV